MVSGCSSGSQSEEMRILFNDQLVRAEYRENGEEPNGAKINGAKINGAKINGAKINGTEIQPVTNISAVTGSLIGFLVATGQNLSGSAFNPSKLTGVLDPSGEAQVEIAGYQQVVQAGLPTMDSYLVIDPVTGESICGRDDTNAPIYAVPMAGLYSLLTGMPVMSVGMFTFACRYAALQKCNEYGYPDWDNRLEYQNAPLKTGPSQVRDLANYHDACVRMVRADYCGDGQGHTINGTTIDIYDNLNFNTEVTSEDGSDGYYFEAEWGADGAWCINKTRWQSQSYTGSLANNNDGAKNPDWQYILDHCPERIAGNTSKGAARPCGNSSNYNTSVGYSLATSQRTLLRNNSRINRK